MRLLWPWGALALAACGHGSEPVPAVPASQPATGPKLVSSPPPIGAPASDDGSAPPAPPSATPSPTAPAAPAATAPAVSPRKVARCQRDDQCALELDHGCCGTCVSVPLTAISAAANEKARKESARHCAVMDVDCSTNHCSALPPRCEARAVCRKGWCEVTTSKACEG